MSRRGRTSTADFRLYDEFRKLPRSEQKTVLRFLSYLAQEEPGGEEGTMRMLRAAESTEERARRAEDERVDAEA